jgi:hypothetical protein
MAGAGRPESEKGKDLAMPKSSSLKKGIAAKKTPQSGRNKDYGTKNQGSCAEAIGLWIRWGEGWRRTSRRGIRGAIGAPERL